MNTYVNTYTTVTALGADAVVSGKFLYLKGFEPMLVRGISPTTVQAPVTEQLQVDTTTPTVANSTDYQFSLVYTNKYTGNEETFVSTIYTSDATATATEICNWMRAEIAGQPQIPITGSGTTTAIFTAQTGYAGFTTTSIGPGVLSVAHSTAAIWAVGLGSQIIQGNYAQEDAMASIVSTSYYYQVEMNFANGDPNGTSQTKSSLIGRNVLYVLSTATNVLTLLGTYGTLTQALAGTTATWTAGTGTLAYTSASGAIELASSGTWPDQGILVGDILVFAVADTTYYPVYVESDANSGLSATALHADVSATTYFYITLRKA